MLLRFSNCNWIEKKRDIIITGPTGLGKSFLASSLGYQGCMYGFRVLYFNCAKLFSQLKLKKADGTYNKELERIQKQEVLILDYIPLMRTVDYSSWKLWRIDTREDQL